MTNAPACQIVGAANRRNKVDRTVFDGGIGLELCVSVRDVVLQRRDETFGSTLLNKTEGHGAGSTDKVTMSLAARN